MYVLQRNSVALHGRLWKFVPAFFTLAKEELSGYIVTRFSGVYIKKMCGGRSSIG